jgi:phage terminase large subunit GpA-like protein
LVVKGIDGGSAAIGQPNPVEVGYAGKKIKRGVKVWPVSTGMLKSELYGWLKLERPTEESGEPFPPGFCHFPQLPDEFFKQLTAEQLITKIIKGYRKPEWVKIRERNEALDTRVYARAAASQVGLDRVNDERWLSLEEQISRRPQTPAVPPAAAAPAAISPQVLPPRRQNFLGDRAKGWLHRY